jgi:4-diphosphocytidyl-2-C-methyl-D-erythritol kinase
VNTSVTVRVPAKINLQLAVGPLRPDGYHDLVTVFHAVSLFDEVTVTPAETDSVTVAGEGAREVPADDDNLALRAARALREATGQGHPTRVAITKRIPVAAGMAGGSADCAAALVACNRLWGTGLSHAELSSLAAALGSDVPFALLGGTVVGRGRGEQLTPVLAAQATYHWVLAYAAGNLSTPLVYKTLDQLRGTAVLSGDTASSEGTAVPDPELSGELMVALRAGDPARLGQALSNDLQAPAISLFPALRKTLSAGSELGALGALVSGSGPTCFFLARDAAHATDLAVQLSGAGACRTVATAIGPAPGAEVI